MLSMLSFACTGGSPSRLHNLPSWVPDWTNPPDANPLTAAGDNTLLDRAYNASGSTAPVIQPAPNPTTPTLTLAGHTIDTIAHLGPICTVARNTPPVRGRSNPSPKPSGAPSSATAPPRSARPRQRWAPTTPGRWRISITYPRSWRAGASLRRRRCRRMRGSGSG